MTALVIELDRLAALLLLLLKPSSVRPSSNSASFIIAQANLGSCIVTYPSESSKHSSGMVSHLTAF